MLSSSDRTEGFLWGCVWVLGVTGAGMLLLPKGESNFCVWIHFSIAWILLAIIYSGRFPNHFNANFSWLKRSVKRLRCVRINWDPTFKKMIGGIVFLGFFWISCVVVPEGSLKTIGAAAAPIGGALLASKSNWTPYGFVFMALSSSHVTMAGLMSGNSVDIFYGVSLFIFDFFGICRWVLRL